MVPFLIFLVILKLVGCPAEWAGAEIEDFWAKRAAPCKFGAPERTNETGEGQ